MGVVLEYAVERHPEWIPYVLNNWRRHLRVVHGPSPVPASSLESFDRAVARWGDPAPDDRLWCPMPYPWIVDWL
jgi:hypothetical protein